MGSCIVVDGSCTTVVNPDTGDAKAFVLDYSFDSSDPSDRSICCYFDMLSRALMLSRERFSL